MPAKVTEPTVVRRGPSGSATPNAVLTALTNMKRLPRFAITLAKDTSVRSTTVSPAPARPKCPGVARPASAERSVKLAMEPRPLRIEEHGVANLHRDVAVAHRIVGAHALADALRPARQHAEPDPAPQHRRESDRGHVAFVAVDPVGGADTQEMRAGAQPRVGIDRPEA